MRSQQTSGTDSSVHHGYSQASNIDETFNNFDRNTSRERAIVIPEQEQINSSNGEEDEPLIQYFTPTTIFSENRTAMQRVASIRIDDVDLANKSPDEENKENDSNRTTKRLKKKPILKNSPSSNLRKIR
jgi:hypothetical protein